MFVGREYELDELNKAYSKNTFQFSVIYGRRRVGKSTLINVFTKGKKSIYFVAIQSTAKENLEILSSQILTTLAPDAPKNPFTSYREAIEYVFEKSKTERIIFTIDEYPYLANSDKAISSILQAAIDKHQSDSQLFLILCGSSMSFMEKQVLGYESPLYGRRTSQYKILPFNYLDSSRMLSGFNNEEKIVLYSVTGGVPEYLARVDNALTLKENVYELFFKTSGRLFEEPGNLIKQELKNPETYNAIIAAIASGSSRLNEISTKVGIETSQCSNMMSSLISLGIVKKEYPVTEETSKKTIYLLDDWMFIFWYRFIQPELSYIISGLGDKVCDEVFDKYINSHVGRAFEACVKQYMWVALKNDTLPVLFRSIGRWWGKDNRLGHSDERKEVEIDFIAHNRKDAIFGQCKWRNIKTCEDVLNELVENSNIFPHFKKKYYMIFSKSNFSDSLKKRSDVENNIILLNVDDMF